jgi:hypothetical protein
MVEARRSRARLAGAVGGLVAALVAGGCASASTSGGSTASSASAPSSTAAPATTSGTGPAAPGTTRAPGASGTSAPTSAFASTAALVAAACDQTLVRGVAGTVTAPELNEVSGVVASTTNPGVLWVHNDSGDAPRAFALTTSGTVLGTYALGGATAQDWEDMAIGPGPGPGERALYFGDIGDNGENRASITVFRVREPKVDPASPVGTVALEGVDELTFTYPDGAHNAETLLVDTDGSIYVVTKKAGSSTVFRAPPGLVDGSTTELSEEGTVPLDAGALLTGGDIAPAGDAVVLRTYGQVYLYERPPGSTIGATLAGARCTGDLAKEPQGEAVTFSADGASYLTMSEGVDQPITTYRAP